MNESASSSLALKKLSRSSKVLLFSGLLAVVLLIGIIDYATGAELAFSVFYLFPVGIAAWYLALEAGISLSIVSALAWYIADTLAQNNPLRKSLHPGLEYRRAADDLPHHDRAHCTSSARPSSGKLINARIDPLTGAPNTRAFYEAAEIQISLLKRYQRPFSILYLDIDNFKELNDTHGHSAGDSALKMVTIRSSRTFEPATPSPGWEATNSPSCSPKRTRVQRKSSPPASSPRSAPSSPSPAASGRSRVLRRPPPWMNWSEKLDHLMYEAKRGGKDTKMSSTFTGS